MDHTMTCIFYIRHHLTEDSIEKILNTLMEFEASNHGDNNIVESLECIKQNVENLEILQWIINSQSKGCSDRPKSFLRKTKFFNKIESNGTFTRFTKVVSFLLCLGQIGFYFFDILKDLAALQVFILL